MSENKRYYWLKLNENFFEDDTIAWIEEQTNGKDYVIFYLKLCLRSLGNDGYLARYVGKKLIPYDIDALAKLTNTPTDTVAVAMKTFLEIGLVTRMETGEIYMNQINEMIGNETDSARRMRKKRALEAQIKNELPEPSQSDSDVQKSDTEIDIDKEIDKEINKDNVDKKNPKKNKYGEFKNVLLTDDEHKKLTERFPTDYKERIERLSGYVASTGKSYKSHYATIINWAKKDSPVQTKKQADTSWQQQIGEL